MFGASTASEDGSGGQVFILIYKFLRTHTHTYIDAPSACVHGVNDYAVTIVCLIS